MSAFASDVKAGLSAQPKYLLSKYFYDANGSRIFQQIMHMPEYYLTNSEFEILSNKGPGIHRAMAVDGPFTIVEFGAGDGLKTRQLIHSLHDRGALFEYMPVDISSEALQQLETNMRTEHPDIPIDPVTGDYFTDLCEIERPGTSVFALFLGSNIGNFQHQDALELLRTFRDWLRTGDHLLIGFDLRKNPNTIRNAYSDPHGITKAFNMNLLKRINRELGGNFDIDHFDFFCEYDPVSGEVNSYLVSLKEQSVYISMLDETYLFEQNELVWTELSKKYSPEEIQSLARDAGFVQVDIFMDCRHYFADALWLRP